MPRRRLLSVLLIALMCLSLARTALVRADGPAHLGYGMMLAWPGHLDRITAAGFDWFKYFLYWSEVQPTEGGRGGRQRS
jgi:hypothetical protein